MSQEKRANIRNSTAEFLIFTGQSGENSIEVRIAEDSVWLTQKLMGTLFEVSIPTINEHLFNILQNKEIRREATIRNFRIVQKEGTREVSRDIEFYNLEAIIAVGFRVNSLRAIQFRQWAVSILKDFAIRGYALDKERWKNGSFDRFITMYLDYAEDRASRNIPMTMKDWAEKLNAFLQFNERDILNNPGKVSKEVAKAFAESEFEKYRIVQDRLFESDFDKHIKHALENQTQLIGNENPELSPTQ